MSKQFLAILAILTFVFSACETRETGNIKDVTQSEIYQDLSFTSNGSSTTVRATLSFAGVRGTTLKLTNPSKILFEGQPLEEKNGQYSGTYYEKTFDTILNNGTFVFTDTKGKTYTNKVELPAIDFRNSPTQINRAAITKMPITNGAKISGCEVNLKISYQDKQGFQSTTVPVLPQKNGIDSAYFDSKTQSIVIEPNLWRSVKANKVEIEIASKSSQNLQQATAIGGKINSEYSGKIISVILSGKNVAAVSPVIPKSNINTKVQASNIATNVNITQSANTNVSSNIANTAADSVIKKPLLKKQRINK